MKALQQYSSSTPVVLLGVLLGVLPAPALGVLHRVHLHAGRGELRGHAQPPPAQARPGPVHNHT